MFQPCPGIAEIALHFTLLDGQQGINTFHVSNTGPDAWTDSDLLLLCTAFKSWFEVGDGAGSTYRSRISDDVTLDTITALDLTVAGSSTASILVGDAGNDAGTDLDNGMSFALKRLTGLAGRSNRGRVYLVGLTAGSVEGGAGNQVTAAAVTDWVNAFDSLIAAVSGAGTVDPAVYVVLSRHTGGALRTDGVGQAVTSHSATDLYMDFQRRRAPGHNRHH